MTFRKHLDDLLWRYNEAGMLPQWQFLSNFADATTVGTFVAGAGMIGAIDVDAASNPGLTAAVGSLLNASGQLDLVDSTTLEFGAGAVPREVPTNTR